MPPTNPAIFTAPPGSTVLVQGAYEAGARFGVGSQAGAVPVCLFLFAALFYFGNLFGS